MDAFAEWYRAQPEVAHIFAISDIVKRLNRNLNGDDPDFYSVPDNSELAAQYLLLYEFSLPVGLDFNNLIDVERSATRATVVLSSLSTNEKIELDDRAQARLRENAPGLETGAAGVSIVAAHSIQKNIKKHADRYHYRDGHRLLAPDLHLQERASRPDQFGVRVSYGIDSRGFVH